MRIYVAVSGHGFGHFGQVVPVLNGLFEQWPTARFLVAGSIPDSLINARLKGPYQHSPRPRDVGLVQHDPMTPDLDATRGAMREFHAHWSEHLSRECDEIAAFGADLVLADTPCLTLEAAAHLGVPSVAVCNLTWEAILPAYFDVEEPEVAGWLTRMRSAYARATLVLLPEPFIPEIRQTFPNRREIPPLCTPGRRRQRALKRALGIREEDARPLVLVSLGGIPAQHLPLERLRTTSEMVWITDHRQAPFADPLFTIHDETLSGWSFSDLSASVDAVVGKPGYGMSVDAVAHGVPFLFMCRGHFPDEAPIVAWLRRHARCREITPEQFYDGRCWVEHLRALMEQTPPRIPALNGAERAVGAIDGMINTKGGQ
ncbi:MAG: hypothetical protein HQL50_08775 [Magnetococcales bacterium]|nr:hypothetical protein [Magnetococcales bacterium]